MKQTLEHAISLACLAHAGQVDKAGQPYILHPLRVMLAVESFEEERMVAVLHDVVEDTHTTLEMLYAFGYPSQVVTAVNYLTRQPGVSYNKYIERLCRGPRMAMRVKLMDLQDNMDLSRLPTPTDHDRQRTVRYVDTWHRVYRALRNAQQGQLPTC